ncbi:MAG: hypothetical protein IKV75_00680 [Bacteroidales bacterium]|nr:hypothetical protein [Bacteroidales bacterium]
MKRIILLSFALCLSAIALTAQTYPQVVTFETSDDVSATFVSVGVSDKAKDVAENAAQSLFYTLFYNGVDGINDGRPLIATDNKDYVNTFLSSRYPFFVRANVEMAKPEKNAAKMFQGNYRITVVYGNLLKDLERNKLYKSREPELKYSDVEYEEGIVLPTIMVVPYKRDGETYASVLSDDFDRRIAVSKVQDGFESRDVTTVDVEAKIAAVKRNSEFGANDADSNDKQLLMNSGADVYVVVDLMKDVNADGSRVSLIMKAYETASGNVLASKDAITKRFATASTDLLCSHAVKDNLPAFLDDICKNFSKQASNGKKVTLQFAIDGSSAMTMNDRVGPDNYPLSNLIHQWVRKNSHNGKYHLQGMVDTSVIFDYVMIPPRDEDGLVMDAAQYGFKIEAWLNDTLGLPCVSRFDGTTIYITIL